MLFEGLCFLVFGLWLERKFFSRAFDLDLFTTFWFVDLIPPPMKLSYLGTGDRVFPAGA